MDTYVLIREIQLFVGNLAKSLAYVTIFAINQYYIVQETWQSISAYTAINSVSSIPTTSGTQKCKN